MPASPRCGSVVLHWREIRARYLQRANNSLQKKHQHRLGTAAGCLKPQLLAVTRCGSPDCSSRFVFHKKQHLPLFGLAEKRSVRPLGLNLDLAKGHATAQQLRSSSALVLLPVIYLYRKPLWSPRFLLAASITPSPLCSSSLALCSITLGNYIHFVSLFFLLLDGQNPG